MNKSYTQKLAEVIRSTLTWRGQRPEPDTELTTHKFGPVEESNFYLRGADGKLYEVIVKCSEG